MSKFSAVALSLLALSATPTFASDALLKKHNCTACHAIDKKVVGPAYKDVAKKYASDGNAAANLAKKIKAGGSGFWGPIPMPPHPQVPDQDIRALVKYILSQK